MKICRGTDQVICLHGAVFLHERNSDLFEAAKEETIEFGAPIQRQGGDDMNCRFGLEDACFLGKERIIRKTFLEGDESVGEIALPKICVYSKGMILRVG